MHCFWNYFLTDLRRLLRSYRWLAGILGVTLALFFSLESDLFQVEAMNGNVLGVYMTSMYYTGSLIAYVFCAFPFAAAYPEERERKYIRYSVIRGGLGGYVWAKTAVIWISSVCVMILGTLLFLLLWRTQVPWMDVTMMSHGVELAGSYGGVLEQGHALLYGVLCALNMGLLAAALSNMAAMCSILLSNTVLVYIFPVLAYRVLICVNIGGHGVQSFSAYNPVLTGDWANFLLLFSISAGVSVLSALGCYFGLKRKL